METRPVDDPAGSGIHRRNFPIRSLCRRIPALTAFVFLAVLTVKLCHLEPCIYVFCACALSVPILYLLTALVLRRCGAAIKGKLFLLIALTSLSLAVTALFTGRETEQKCRSSHQWIWPERQ